MRRAQVDRLVQAEANRNPSPKMVNVSPGTDTILTNYAANGDFTGDTHHTGGIGGGPAGWTSIGIASDKAHSGTRSFKLENCTAPGQAARKAMTSPSSVLKVMKGQKVSWSFWVYSTKAGTIASYWEGRKVSDSTYTGGGGGSTAVQANTWTYITATNNITVDSYVDGAGGYNLQVDVGDSVWFDEFCITVTDTAYPYFDGSTPADDGYAYSWAGTANSSISHRKAMASIVRTNLVCNPAFRATSGLTTVRTNLATNPSFEATSGTTIIRKNLVSNPSFEASAGPVTTRTNLAYNPNFEVDKTGYGSANQSTVDRVLSTSMSGSAVGRITFTGDTITDSGMNFAGAFPSAPNKTYYVSMDVLSSATRSVRFSAQGAGTVNQSSTGIPLTAGVRTRISWSFQTTASGAIATYLLRSDLLLGTIDVDRVLIEEYASDGTYFDGITPAYQNLVTNPSFASNTTGWNANSGNITIAHDLTVGRVGIGCAKAQVALASSGDINNFNSKISARAGDDYTASAYIRCNISRTLHIKLEFRDAANNAIGSATTSSVVTADWVRLSVTAMAPADTDSIFVRIGSAAVESVGTTWWVDDVLVEKSSTLREYFEGTGDFTYSWTGTAHSSTSLQQAVLAAGVTALPSLSRAFQSSHGVTAGSKSIKIVPTHATSTDSFAEFNGMLAGYTFKANTTYTLAADRTLHAPLVGFSNTFVRVSIGSELGQTLVATPPNTAGTSRLVLRFTTGADASVFNFIRLYAGVSAANGGAVWYDRLTLEEGVTDGSYFDGATPQFRNMVVQAAQALSGVTLTTGVSYAGSTWSRSSVAAGTGGWITRQYVPLSDLVHGRTYTTSVTVANDQAWPQSVALDWCDGASQQVTLAPGETRRLVVTGSRSIYDTTFRFSDLQVNQSATEGRSVLFKDWLIEEGTTAGTYYTGTGDFTYEWTGTANASSSNQKANVPVGTVANYNSAGAPGSKFFGYSSTDETGNKVSKWLSPAGTPNSVWRVAGMVTTAFSYTPILLGKTYTLYFKYRASGWPASSNMLVQISNAGAQEHVITNDTNKTLNGTGWQEYKRTFVALRDAAANSMVYLSLPVTPSATSDSALELAEWSLIEGEHYGSYFDGSTPASGDFSYEWSGTANASTSLQKAVYVPHHNAESKVAVYGTPSGTLKAVVKDSSGAGGRSFVPSTVPGAGLQLTAGTTYTIKLRAKKLTNQTTLRLAGGISQFVPLTTSMADYSYTVTPSTTSSLFVEQQQTVLDSGVEFEYLSVFDGSYPGANFDGSSFGSESLTRRWTGTPDASTSQEIGALTAGYSDEVNIKHYKLADGAMRVINTKGTSNSLQTSAGSTVAGKRHTILIRARSYNGGQMKIFGLQGTPMLSLTSAYEWFRIVDTADNTTLYLSTQGGIGGAGFDISHMLIAVGRYDGAYFDGSYPEAKWLGGEDNSISVGYAF